MERLQGRTFPRAGTSGDHLSAGFCSQNQCWGPSPLLGAGGICEGGPAGDAPLVQHGWGAMMSSPWKSLVGTAGRQLGASWDGARGGSLSGKSG